jgi:hypothetical protein
MSTAQLVEVLARGAAKYQCSPPWKGRNCVVVAPMTLLNGKALTYVYAADQDGTTDEGGAGEGRPTILETLADHPSHHQVLDRFGYRLV